VGRGASGWLPVPSSYGFPQYLADMAALIARLDVDEVEWVGTSMGGITGLMLAAQTDTPIRRLVINDAGAFISAQSLEYIANYVGEDPTFKNLAELEEALRTRLSGFAPVTDEQWTRMARNSARHLPDGTWKFGYDPAIGTALHSAPLQDVDLWPLYDRIACPTLVLRGADSPILTADIAQQMTARGPRAKLVEFANVGHAPSLMAHDQIAVVRDFLTDLKVAP
jgi:pimeloyl-ACP methyl ester carboxylesterase